MCISVLDAVHAVHEDFFGSHCSFRSTKIAWKDFMCNKCCLGQLLVLSFRNASLAIVKFSIVSCYDTSSNHFRIQFEMLKCGSLLQLLLLFARLFLSVSERGSILRLSADIKK